MMDVTNRVMSIPANCGPRLSAIATVMFCLRGLRYYAVF